MSTASDSSTLTAEGTRTYQREVEDAASALPPLPSSTIGILHGLTVDSLLKEGTIDATIPHADIPHFPTSDGTLRTGSLDDTHVVELPQHLHLYDGHTPREVTFPVRMLAAAGVDTLILTATAGSVNPQFERGDLMLLTDHINFQGQNPLVGPNVEDWGPRFPDMTNPYDSSLRQGTTGAAQEEGISLQKGIYLALLGPNEETTAEHRMARRLGADAVGTSVIPEVIAARHMDVRVLGLTVLTEQHLTNDGPPTSAEGSPPLQTARSHLRRLLRSVVEGLDGHGTTT